MPTPKNRIARKAQLVQVLVNYDGPQLALFKTDRGLNMLGIAVENPKYVYPFFCCEVHKPLLARYLEGRVDLLFVFKSNGLKNRYFLDYMEDEGDSFSLKNASSEDIENDNFYPSRGLFSRSHTSQFDAGALNTKVSRFLIDGTWESEDFSRFHGKISDVYAMTFIAGNTSPTTISAGDKAYLRESISTRNWQGGGSYLSFYVGAKAETRHEHPLRVKSISYHSPGYIELQGDAATLDSILNIIDNFIVNIDNINSTYKTVYSYLRKEKLLSAEKSKTFSSTYVSDYVKGHCLKLGESVSLPNSGAILADCNNNVVVFAKILLSYCRRLNEVAKFYAEGRIKRATGGDFST
jgi:hypothetical protein